MVNKAHRVNSQQWKILIIKDQGSSSCVLYREKKVFSTKMIYINLNELFWLNNILRTARWVGCGRRHEETAVSCHTGLPEKSCRHLFFCASRLWTLLPKKGHSVDHKGTGMKIIPSSINAIYQRWEENMVAWKWKKKIITIRVYMAWTQLDN